MDTLQMYVTVVEWQWKMELNENAPRVVGDRAVGLNPHEKVALGHVVELGLARVREENVRQPDEVENLRVADEYRIGAHVREARVHPLLTREKFVCIL